MSKQITIDLDEAIRVHRFISDVVAFMHQPMNYDKTQEFAIEHLEEMKAVYYKITWNWLPEDIQEKLMEE